MKPIEERIAHVKRRIAALEAAPRKAVHGACVTTGNRKLLRAEAEARLGPRPPDHVFSRFCSTPGCYAHVEWATKAEQCSRAGIRGATAAQRIGKLKAQLAHLESILGADGDFGATLGLPAEGPCLLIEDEAVRRVVREAAVASLGPKPPGAIVCRRCDEPLCCAPAHLFLGSYRDNARDAVLRGRPRGNPSSLDR